MFRAQSFVIGDNMTDAEKRWGWVLPLGQFAYAAALFLIASYAGGALFTLLAGGLLGLFLLSAAHSIRSILFYRSIAIPGAVRGTLSMSTAWMIRQRANFYFEAAFLYLSTGLLLPHLALLGAALISSASGLEYLRQARRAEAHL
jgi:hypothetical protein